MQPSRFGRAAVGALLVMLLAALPAVAQTGTIAGVLVDAENGETLIGANARIEGTATGAATDIDGRFAISNVEPGTYTLVFSYIGYNTATVTEVVVAAGETTRLELALTPESVSIDEVIVEATALTNTEASLLRTRQKAAAVSDAISAQAMAQTGSGDAADAMSKVTGASVVGGKYVYVRGLGGRYSSAQLNGTNLPSADPDQNSAQLDLFPTNLLDNIVATKTFTPDQPGSFSGGSVNITTKAFPDALTFKLSSSLAYNTEVSFSDDFLTGPTGETDWLGFDEGMREIPAALNGSDLKIPRASQARNNPDLAQQLDALSKSFNSVMVPRPGEAGMNQGYALSFGNQFSLFGRPFGFVASGTYSRAYGGYEDGATAQFEATDPNADSLNVNFDFADRVGEQKAGWGLLGNLTYQVHPYHELGFNVLRTQDGEQVGRYQVGTYPKNTRPPVHFETYVLQYTERAVSSYQGRGAHYLKGAADLRAEWNAAVTSTSQEDPDLRFFFDQFVQVDLDRDGTPDTTVYDINLGSSNATPPTRVFRDLQEDNVEANVSFELPVHLGLASALRFKTGASFLRKERAFRERKFNYRDNALDFSDFGGDIDAFFSSENVGIIAENDGRHTFGNTIEEGTRPANNYDGTQQVTGVFGMVDASLSRRLRFIGGARYETTDMEIISQDSTKAAGEISEGDVLPSLNLIYALGQNMNLRASATRTLARPTFREIAPFTSFSFAGGPELSGNPDLERTLITNLDARWEWFARPGEIYAVSGFYKYFQDPIERVFLSNNNQVSFVNVPSATVYGLEFEIRKTMGWLAEPLRYLTVSANLALIHSNVDVPPRELELAEGFDIGAMRPFQGQSPYVLNVGLAYENYESGTLATLAFNRYGERLSSVTLGGAPNIFEQPRNDLFVSVGQRVFNLLDVRLSIDNLLRADFVESQEYKGATFVTRRYDLGRTVKLSFSYDL